jgi:hypothetical protein
MEYYLKDAHSMEELIDVATQLDFGLVHHTANQGFGVAWFDK